MPKVANIEFPSTLIADAGMAQIICDGGYVAHSKYHASIANMIEQFDGKLPKNPAELEKAGMNWVSNVPYRRGQAKIEAVSTARLNMYRAAIYFSQIQFKPWDDSYEDDVNKYFLSQPDISRNLAQKVSSIFIETIHRDKCFIPRFLLPLAHQQVAWGYAVSVCRDHSVFSEVPELLNIYFERADRPENIKIFIEAFPQRAADLYRLYTEEKAKSFTYYKLDGLEDALYWALPFEMQKSYNSWAAITKSYDHYALLSTYQNQADILWAWIWNEEIDGTLTKTMYQWARGMVNTPNVSDWQGSLGSNGLTANVTRDNTVMPNGRYLAYQRHYPKSKSIESVWRAYLNNGISNDRVIQNLRGLGVYAYEDDVQYNIYRNALNDTGFLAGNLYFQPDYGQQLEAIPTMTIAGPIVTLPAGLPLIREDFVGRKMQYQIQLLEYQDNEFREITQQYDPQVAGQLTDRATNQQVQAVSSEVARQRQDFSVVPLDSMQGELLCVLQRMKEEYEKDDPGYDAKWYFYKRICELRPKVSDETPKQRKEGEKEFFDAIIDAVDFVALDFLTDDLPGLQMLFDLAPTPEGKEYYRRRLAFARNASFSELQSFFPTADDPAKNINDSSLALLENALFWTTNEIGYNALQNPATHLEIHLLKAVTVIRAVTEGRDPMEVWQWLTNMLPNAQQHLQQLSTDPYQAPLFEQYQDLFDNITQQVTLVGNVASKQAQVMAQQMQQQAEGQQQAAPQGIDPETQAKLATLQVQTEEKMRRTQELSAQRSDQKKADFALKTQMQQQSFAQQQQQSAERFALEQQLAIERNQNANS